MSRTPGDRNGPFDRELVAVTLLLAAVALAVPIVDAADSTPPSFEGAEKVNGTVIEMEFLDGGGIDNSSIKASDFSLSSGTIENVSTNLTDGGGRAHVRLYLKEGINENNVTVKLVGSVADKAGNKLKSANATVTGMDTVSPFVENYSVKRVNETAAKITVTGSEQLGAISLSIGGPTTANLGIDAFTEEGKTYTHVHNFSGQGEYSLLLMDIKDENGNVRSPNDEKTFVVDQRPPTARIAGPRRVTAGETVTFNGGASSDNVDVDSYRWRIEGINGTVESPSIERSFDKPGERRVTLTVTDTRGNVANRTIVVTVRPSMSSRAVTITRADGGTRVEVAGNRSAKIVRIRNETASLVSTGSVAVQELRVTPATNGSFRLTLSATDAPASYDADARSIGAFRVAHGTDRVASEATIRFVVARSAVESLNASAADVALYRNASDWSVLPTNLVSTNDTHLFYTARAPGFSTFVVGVDQPQSTTSEGQSGQGKVVVSKASIDAGGSVGSLTVVRATLTNEGTATATYTAGLVVGSETIATRIVTVPPSETRTITFARRIETAGNVLVNGTAAGSINETSTPTPTPATPDERTKTATPTSSPTPAGNATNGGGGGLVPQLSVPTGLLPGGIIGTVLGALFWLGILATACLKAVAIYLGY